MGHDPRAEKPAEAPVEIEESYEIDLERELMGDLDFAEFDEPAAEADEGEEQTAWQADDGAESAVVEPDDEEMVDGGVAASEDENPAPELDAPAAVFDDDTPAMADDEYVAAMGVAASEPTRYDDGSPAAVAEFDDAPAEGDDLSADAQDEPALQAQPFDDTPEFSVDDDFGDALERELMAPEAPEAMAVAASEPVRYDDGSRAAVAEFDDATAAEGDDPSSDARDEPALQAQPFDDTPEFSMDEDFGDALERELMAPQMPEASREGGFEPMADEAGPAVPAWAPADEVSEYATDDGGIAEVDMDFGPLDADLAAGEEEAAQPVDEGQEATAAGEAPSVSLWDPNGEWEPAEDEQSTFDADRPDAHEASVSADAPADSAEISLEDELSALLADPIESSVASQAASAAADDTWRPGVSTFGRANFSADSETPQYKPEAAEAFADPAPAEPSVAAETPPAALLDEDDFTDIFGDDLNLDPEPVQEQPNFTDAAATYGEPEELPADAEVDALAAWRPETAEMVPSNVPDSQDDHAPDIETVDISEAAYAIADDLDIPNVDYGAAAPASGLYDDLDSEFAEAFGEFTLDEPAPATTTADVSHQAAAFATTAAYDTAAGGASAGGDPSAYALGEGQWQSGEFPDDGFDYDNDLEQAIAMSAFDDEAPAAPVSRKRGMLVAAVVAAVAVIGGVGVFGMSMFGGADTPAVVRADSDPMKIRPENPGGTTVPNQDSEVYQRVAGGEPDPAPEQENLITTAEEPVDVTAQPEIPALAPGISDESEPLSTEPARDDETETDMAALPAEPKSEDRIEQIIDEPGVGASDDLVAVAPRRVRTMIVRPDGSMVPREDPTPAVTPEPEPESVIAAAPIIGAPALAPANSQLPTLGGEQNAAAEEQEDAGPVVETPDTVAVVPSQRREPQAAAAPVRADPAPVAQQPATQTPAATPVSAAAQAGAAAGAWSMQIASQPTAESAQSTYQDLARRYGGVLEGRGVNIVRADIEGKGVYYRVRIPATSRDEAIQLCTRYKSAGGSCFVSR